MRPVVKYFQDHWNGVAPLWSAFWVHWVLIPGFITVVGIATMETAGKTSELGEFAGLMLIVIAYIYLFVAALFVWRCSIHRENQQFGFIARVLALMGPFLAGLNLIASGFAALVVRSNV